MHLFPYRPTEGPAACLHAKTTAELGAFSVEDVNPLSGSEKRWRQRIILSTLGGRRHGDMRAGTGRRGPSLSARGVLPLSVLSVCELRVSTVPVWGGLRCVLPPCVKRGGKAYHTSPPPPCQQKSQVSLCAPAYLGGGGRHDTRGELLAAPRRGPPCVVAAAKRPGLVSESEGRPYDRVRR
jgi:hypothetical protein